MFVLLLLISGVGTGVIDGVVVVGWCWRFGSYNFLLFMLLVLLLVLLVVLRCWC